MTTTEAAAAFYPIGTPGQKWGDAEKSEWKVQTKRQRSYKEQVLDKIEKLKGDFDVEQYGSLPYDPDRYPLFAIKTKDWKPNHPCVLVTGGVHGYETSGVQGALLFLQTKALEYAMEFNILVLPCVSPWGYEHIQRWDFDIKDPNRSFKHGVQTCESKAVMEYLEKQGISQWTSHVDLHETTDSDATEFMPAKHAEAGLMYEGETIPDGFYLVGDSEDPQLDFQKAVIENVRKVTHIAPHDGKGNMIGEPVVSDGVIVIPQTELGLCGSVTNGTYRTTTEVYPDSPRATDEICNQAQVAAITGALDFILGKQQECAKQE